MNKYDSLSPLTGEPEYCTATVYIDAPDGVVPDYEGVCGKKITVMAFLGTGVCCDNHRKLKGEAPILGEK